ncbi:MAG: HAD-IIA family hydrolase [Planctomycetes bacterium]|nr:HAD-IIA family hydrolase [Planctomycetota bacterium]
MKIFPSFRRWIKANRDGLDAITLDIDGTLANGKNLLSGAADLLARLRADEIPFILLTNDGSNSPAQKVRDLRRYGLRINRDEIVSASHPLDEFAAERKLVGKKVFVMGSLGQPSYAQMAGMTPVTDIAQLTRCHAVIIGEKRYDWQNNINAVINFLAANPQKPLVVPNPDAYFLNARKQMRLAPGALTRLIKESLKDRSIEIETVFLGKPHPRIFRHSHAVLEKRLGRAIPKKRVMMIGDSLASDVAGAKSFGYSVSLVLTGVTTRQMLSESKVKPDLVFKGL